MNYYLYSFLQYSYRVPIRFALSVRICLLNISRMDERIFVKFGVNVMPLKTAPKFILHNFLRPLIPTWRMLKYLILSLSQAIDIFLFEIWGSHSENYDVGLLCLQTKIRSQDLPNIKKHSIVTMGQTFSLYRLRADLCRLTFLQLVYERRVRNENNKISPYIQQCHGLLWRGWHAGMVAWGHWDEKWTLPIS